MGKGIRSFFSISTLEDGTPSDISKGYHVETCRRFADVVELASLLSIVVARSTGENGRLSESSGHAQWELHPNFRFLTK